jgi:zinc protease
MLPRIAAFCALVMIAASPARSADVTSFTLDNGLEVVVLEDHRAPVVVHMMWYRVGSADEPRGKSGIAHFLEHLMFKGTEEVGPGEFSEVVAANGGRDNAFTSFDYTAYFQRVAADRLGLMMEMEADRMVNLVIAPEFVDSERSVVLEERNQRTENDPRSLLNEQRKAAQYLHHPYGVPIIGWRHEIEGLTRDDAIAFYKQHYAPNNAILVVAGDVTPDEVRTLADTHYGQIPPNPAITPRDRVDEPPQLAERRIMFSDPRISQPTVVRTYLAPERDAGAQEDAAALTLLSEVLGGSGSTSVLARKLQFETTDSIYAAAFYSGTSLDVTTFGLVTVPAPGVSLEKAEADLDRAVAEFLEEGIDDAQLARIKTQLRASLIYEEDDISGLANTYGSALTSGLTIADVEAWPDILAATTEDDIIAAARRVFDRDRAVTTYSMPEDAEKVSQ